ncbi:hypothetical protein BU16DRAFT_555418 [Lophium mytilinum]|uniref:Uncharacterized protein n=1 Tax=Lophium mytilinum TaxID=390894 RepID=A0A6A6R7Y0_9PEZI|nr:hypothetical protein BU16DRAFT_555418 [Lophium mytilinum]
MLGLLTPDTNTSVQLRYNFAMLSHDPGKASGSTDASNEGSRDESQSSSTTPNLAPRGPLERSAAFFTAGVKPLSRSTLYADSILWDKTYDPYMPTLPPSQSYSDRLRNMAEAYAAEESKLQAMRACEYKPSCPESEGKRARSLCNAHETLAELRKRLRLDPTAQNQLFSIFIDVAVNAVVVTESGLPAPELEDRLLRWTYSLLDASSFKQFGSVNSFEGLLLALAKLLQDSLIRDPSDFDHYDRISEFVLEHGEEYHYDAIDSVHKILKLQRNRIPSPVSRHIP